MSWQIPVMVLWIDELSPGLPRRRVADLPHQGGGDGAAGQGGWPVQERGALAPRAGSAVPVVGKLLLGGLLSIGEGSAFVDQPQLGVVQALFLDSLGPDQSEFVQHGFLLRIQTPVPWSGFLRLGRAKGERNQSVA